MAMGSWKHRAGSRAENQTTAREGLDLFSPLTVGDWSRSWRTRMMEDARKSTNCSKEKPLGVFWEENERWEKLGKVMTWGGMHERGRKNTER